LDGYPWFFSKNDSRVELKGISDRTIGILDFYESLSCISKVNASLA